MGGCGDQRSRKGCCKSQECPEETHPSGGVCSLAGLRGSGQDCGFRLRALCGIDILKTSLLRIRRLHCACGTCLTVVAHRRWDRNACGSHSPSDCSWSLGWWHFVKPRNDTRVMRKLFLPRAHPPAAGVALSSCTHPYSCTGRGLLCIWQSTACRD